MSKNFKVDFFTDVMFIGSFSKEMDSVQLEFTRYYTGNYKDEREVAFRVENELSDESFLEGFAQGDAKKFYRTSRVTDFSVTELIGGNEQ